jgi:hypothetical protein
LRRPETSIELSINSLIAANSTNHYNSNKIEQGRQKMRLTAIINKIPMLSIILIGLYIVIELAVQLLPPHYSPISQPESLLTIGPYGYLMTINFVIRAIFSLLIVLVLVKGVTSESMPKFRGSLILFGIWGACSLLLAAFPADLTIKPTTLNGNVHSYATFAAFLCGGFSAFTLSNDFKKEKELVTLSRFTFPIGIACIVFAAITIVTAVLPESMFNAWGLIERVFIALMLTWILLLAINLRKLSSLRRDEAKIKGLANSSAPQRELSK